VEERVWIKEYQRSAHLFVVKALRNSEALVFACLFHRVQTTLQISPHQLMHSLYTRMMTKIVKHTKKAIGEVCICIFGITVKALWQPSASIPFAVTHCGESRRGLKV
jgi:hypothetical protein